MASPAEVIVQRLSVLIGASAAQSTVNTFCKRTIGVKPEALTAAQVVLVLPSLKQFLSVMVGLSKAETIVAELTKEFTP